MVTNHCHGPTTYKSWDDPPSKDLWFQVTERNCPRNSPPARLAVGTRPGWRGNRCPVSGRDSVVGVMSEVAEIQLLGCDLTNYFTNLDFSTKCGWFIWQCWFISVEWNIFASYQTLEVQLTTHCFVKILGITSPTIFFKSSPSLIIIQKVHYPFSYWWQWLLGYLPAYTCNFQHPSSSHAWVFA